MGVVQLNACFFWEVSPLEFLASLLGVGTMSSQDILKSSRNEQILLFESELLAGFGGVVGIEHTGDVLSTLSCLECVVVLSSVEGVKIELVEGQRFPESETDSVECSVARNGGVVGSRDNGLAFFPEGSFHTLGIDCFSDFSVESHFVLNVDSFDFPGITVTEPVIWDFDLVAVFYDLFEYTVVITDAIAPSGEVECGERIEETGCQSSQTAVS